MNKPSSLSQNPNSLSSLGKGALWMLLGVFFFALSNIYIEPLSHHYPLGQMIFLRSLLVLIPLVGALPLLFPRNLILRLKEAPLKELTLQGVLSAVCLFFLFYGFAHLSLPIATTLCFCEVFVLTLFGIVFLKERYALGQWGALIVGFGGIILISFQENTMGDIPLWASLSCLAAICVDSLVLISLKKILAHESMVLILILYIAFCGCGGLLFWPFETWAPFQAASLYPLLGLALFMTLGQFFLLKALKNQEASLLSALIYTQIIWALLFTSIEGGSMPSLQEWIGMGLVIGAGLVIYIYQHVKNRIL